MKPIRRLRRTAFSLIELLLVMAIISILASMLLSAVSRAYTKAKALKYDNRGYVHKVQQELSRFYRSLARYPAIPAEALHKNGVISDDVMRFLRNDYVEFFPFSSADPCDKTVLRFKWNSQYELTLAKRDVAACNERGAGPPKKKRLILGVDRTRLPRVP